MSTSKLVDIYQKELSEFIFSDKEPTKKWERLERLHIIGQQFLSKHLYVHFLMLKEAFIDNNFKEIIGQIIRLIFVIPGHMLGRLPLGNVGSSRVSAFKKMDIPSDLKELFDE